MTTGKIEYAPDYKSKLTPKYPDVTHRFRQLDQRHEQLSLKRAVVEAAKADCLATQQGDGNNRDIDAMIQTRRELNQAIDALLAFEANQK